MYAKGKGSEIVRFVRACDRAGDNRVLRLCSRPVDHFDIAYQHNRWWQPSRINHQR